MNEIITIQQGLKSPKEQTNGFGRYKYRRTEDILAAVKHLLALTKTWVRLSDDICEVNGRLFLKATAELRKEDGTIIATTNGWAELDKHAGMCNEQATGAASSYARKYALCGLFAIDDSTNDPDTIETPQRLAQAVAQAEKATTKEGLAEVWKAYPELQQVAQFKNKLTEFKNKLNA